MKATAELQVIPIGIGVSVRKEVICVVEMLKNYDFIIETHASGTNIEGELSQIFSALENIHTTLHKDGVIRLVSYIKLETRTDKIPTLEGKKI